MLMIIFQAESSARNFTGEGGFSARIELSRGNLTGMYCTSDDIFKEEFHVRGGG